MTTSEYLTPQFRDVSWNEGEALRRGWLIERMVDGMQRHSFIQGYGLIGARGNCAQDVFASISAGNILKNDERCPLPVNSELRVVQLAMSSITQAIEKAGWNQTLISDPRTALVVGSSKGPIDQWIAQIEGKTSVSGWMGLAEPAARIGMQLGMCGPRLTYAAACASGLHALIQANEMIQSGQVDRAIVVGCESSVHPIFSATFLRMGALSKRGECRPFDHDRDGFLLSEAAAAVCLDVHTTEGLWIDATGLYADAHHITAVDPQADALKRVLMRLNPEKGVDLIHAHGTATALNDPVELYAIESCLRPGDRPHLFSHKAALGHTQGAAGMIAVVLNVMMHERRKVLPIANLQNPLESRSVIFPVQCEYRFLRRSWVLAAGFGGVVAGISLQNHSEL